jgi:hypothetical protein
MNIQMKSRGSRVLTLSLGLLAIAACSSETATDGAVASADATASTAPAAKHSGVLETKQGAYRFTPTSCIFHKENGVYDIEIEGPGQAPDGEKIYFELTSTGNGVAVKLGVDGRYQSSDRKLVAGQHVTEAFTLDVSDQSLSIPKLVLADSNGQKVDDSASLRINCNG